MTQFLVASLLLSLVLTVVLNLLARIPGVQEWVAARLSSLTPPPPPPDRPPDEGRPRVRVFVPWKAMLIGSIVLTILVNVIGALW